MDLFHYKNFSRIESDKKNNNQQDVFVTNNRSIHIVVSNKGVQLE
jgi:hypothetical protein